MSNGTEQNSPVHNVWKPECESKSLMMNLLVINLNNRFCFANLVYKIQLEAPTPKALLRSEDTTIDHSEVDFYGYEYHGEMGHKQSDALLYDKCDGTYLVRRSPGATDCFTLSLRFNGKTKNYKIFYKPNYGHFLKENLKKYDSIHDLVADGLVDSHMRYYASDIIKSIPSKTNYQQSPYMTLNRRKLCALSKDLRKSLKYNNMQTMNDNVNMAVSNLAAATISTLADMKIANGQKITDECVSANSTEVSTDDFDLFADIYQKPHKFKAQNFTGLNWCEFCGNFLWGYTVHGVKCEDCGCVAHDRCSELAPPQCMPDLKKFRGIFGLDLTTVVSSFKCTVPFVVRCCVQEVEARGMLQEGIYRVSGFADEIEALKLAFDQQGEKTNLSEKAYNNINVVAGTLKMYLRLLPVPLVTYNAYPTFIQSASESTIYWVFHDFDVVYDILIV